MTSVQGCTFLYIPILYISTRRAFIVIRWAPGLLSEYVGIFPGEWHHVVPEDGHGTAGIKLVPFELLIELLHVEAVDPRHGHDISFLSKSWWSLLFKSDVPFTIR